MVENMDSESILKQYNIDTTVPRTNWIPMLDATQLVVGLAWRNDEELAWLLFMAEPQGSA